MTNIDCGSLPEWMYFVGKWGDAEIGHPLMYHLLDSAAVARLLWQRALTAGARKQFSHWLHLPEDACGELIAFWTSLHDLGKAAPTFQCKHTPTRIKLENLGFLFPPISQTGIRHHSLLSQWILKDYETDLNIQPVGDFNRFRFAIGGHHGTFHVQEDREKTNYPELNLGNDQWKNARRDLFYALNNLINPPAIPTLAFSQTDRNAFYNLLTGFFVTADWISSQDDLFRYYPASSDLQGYWEKSQETALSALEKTGWIGWHPDVDIPSFDQLFGFVPNSLQESVTKTTQGLRDPFFMIIEAPTGSGKTEAALSVADQAIQANDLRGFYIAMPTQATSNQMFGRTSAFLSKRYPKQKQINVQLVHGNAIIDNDFKKMRMASVDDQEGNQEGNVNASEWFLPRKRSLLAPFGVGTVDQTFFSVLRIRHSFLRLFGLYRKVVIFDEVHAYDVYMQEIFCQLLAWLRAIGSSVIILSATLPNKARLEFLQAYQPATRIDSSTAKYPRLSMNDGETISTVSLGEYPDRTIHLTKVPSDPQTWIELLRVKLAEGGCAAIICNRVNRAQEIYCQIRSASLVNEDELFLLHACTPYCWRNDTEDKILRRFGKQEKAATSPRRGIVVATQVIEQSLDLDFDLLITDLAPIDLLIQRIGRLHRHTGKEHAPLRPEGLREPLCIICQPGIPDNEELPDFGKDIYVYENAVLQRTFFTLSDRKFLQLPSDSDQLINTIYSDDDLRECSKVQNQAIHENYKEMMRNQENEVYAALNRMIGDVDCSNALGEKAVYLKENDEGVSDATRALTRNNILPSVQLVCIVREGIQTFLLDGHFPYSIQEEPYGETLDHLRRSMVTVSLGDVRKHFQYQPHIDSWRKLPSVRYAQPAVFIQGVCELADGKKLILDEHLGLFVQKG